MYVTQVQSRLKSVWNEETNKRDLVPCKVWQALDEFDEFDYEEDINHSLKHQISIAARQMNLSEEEVQDYFRLKEVYIEEEED